MPRATFSVIAAASLNQPLVTNVVSATAFEDPDPKQASAIDPVARGGAIGDLVWLDLDGDGVYDNGEPGIANVRVWLDTNGNGTFEPGTDLETLTDLNGEYLFEYLPPGTYAVNVDETTLPNGLSRPRPYCRHLCGRRYRKHHSDDRRSRDP